MGYCVEFKGSFKLSKRMCDATEAAYRTRYDEENWPNPPDDRFNPWKLSDDGASLTVETDKPGDWKSWLQYTIDRVLAPEGIGLSGSVEWDGEERGDEGVITVEGWIVKNRRRPTSVTWDKLTADQREIARRMILNAKADDYDIHALMWDAVLCHLGLRPGSDRTVFDNEPPAANIGATPPPDPRPKPKPPAG